MPMGTSLVPLIGDDRAAEIAQESARSGRPVRAPGEEKQVLPPAERAKALNPFERTKPGGEGRAGG